jgi:hypothetical protein
MNHLNNCFHHWHCPSGFRTEYLLLSSYGITLHALNRLKLWISNPATYRDRRNCYLASGRGRVYMPQRCSWGKFKVPFLYNCCLDHHFWNASFNLQQLQLWVVFPEHISMAYNIWEWKIDHWLTKSNQYSLPPLWRLYTIVCQPGKQTTLVSRRGVVQ